ncbi:MAG: hypothetical protein NW223_13850 [Hyphomicrobiaceae bacterium]|nr:hypothetical protein [Hyphomicrobiaceae bacterium]
MALAVCSGLFGPAHAQGTSGISVTVPKVTSVEAPSQTPLAISIAPAASVPRNSFLRLRGLPPMAALTEGYAIAPGSWAVSLAAAANLKVSVPVGAEGRADIAIALVSVDGIVLAETQTTLLIGRLPQAASPTPPSATIMRAAPLDVPAPAARPTLTPAEHERALRLFKRGEDQLKDANVAEARLFFEKAADAGLAEAALALGGTYEQAELDKLGIRGARADVGEARRWYERAAQLGAGEARQRLQRLGGK